MALLMRYVAAIIGAALVAAVLPMLPTLLGGQAGFVFFAFIVALAHAAVLGLPAAFVFQRLGWLNIGAAVGAGFLIGALPVAVLMALLPQADFASIGGVPTAVGGELTLAGWFGILQAALFFGLFGAMGGIAAWLIWQASPRVLWASGAGVIALAALVLASPVLLKDRSCHNALRDGRTSIGPEMRAHLPIAPSEWPALTQVFQGFAGSAGWSFRNSSDSSPIQTIDLSVCSDEGTKIWALQQIWPDKTTVFDRGVAIGVYQPQGGKSWEAPMQRLLQSIESRWPGKLTFEDETGGDMPAPEFLGRSTP